MAQNYFSLEETNATKVAFLEVKTVWNEYE